MRSYDFGNKLEEQQFEKLACEVVGQREGIRLQTYRKGKDQGKDGFWYDEKDNIVLQAKCYQDFQNLFKKLKGEVKKVEKLQPKRYILVVSLPLSAGEAEKIRELFGGWIRKSEDLIDGNMLNSLLSDPDYRVDREEFYRALDAGRCRPGRTSGRCFTKGQEDAKCQRVEKSGGGLPVVCADECL